MTATAEVRVGAPDAGARTSRIVLGSALGLAVLVGAAVAGGRLELALAAGGGVFAVAAVRELPLAAWCGLLLLTTIVMRGLVEVLSLPASLNFVHYPVAAGMAVAALRRPGRLAARAPGVWIAGLVAVSLLSLVANLSHPLRAVVFLLILGEPLVVVWALCRWEIAPAARRTIGWIALALALTQLPIAAVQATGHGFGDFVKGTLVGHGAGHHVLGALFALALLVVTAAVVGRRLPLVPGVVAAATCLTMMLATGSTAVTILTALVVPAVPILAARATGRGRLTGAAPAVIGLVLGAAALLLVQVLVPTAYDRARRVASPDESYELALVDDRLHDPAALVLGSGPGTTASRASLLLVGAEGTDSPLASLGLEPTAEGERIAASTLSEYGGSAEAARSSALGLLGDVGLLGLAGTGLVLARMWRATARSRHWLAPAARAAVGLTALLMFVDNWLEYPEFAVPLALLVGLVLSDRRSDERATT